MRCYDLHCHSNHSDGILSPEALVSRAKEKEVEVLALTDHDTITGIAAARAQADKEGIELINGSEFSCLWAGRNIHIVALNFDPMHEEIQALLDSQSKKRLDRSAMIAEKLKSAGFDGALEAARAISGGGSIGRPHFAKAMVEAGFVSSVDQAFKRYLGAGRPGDIKQMWPEIGEVVQAVTRSKGVAILAHPLKYKMTRSKLCSLVEDFVEKGGKAMEVVSGKQKPTETADMSRIAQRFKLLASCGSDFHSPSMSWGELGAFSPMPKGVDPVWKLWES